MSVVESGGHPVLNARNQVICASCGPAALVIFFIGFAIAGFFPPPGPGESAVQVARLYSEHAGSIRVGTFLMVFASGIVTPFGAVVMLQLRRIEGEAPVFSLTQFAAGTTGIMMFLTEAMFWSIAAYRPGRAPEITQTLNDIAWFFTVMPFCLIFIQALCIAIVILSDQTSRPILPRWLGYFNLWCAVLYVPGGTMTFFHSGPLAWNGAFAFWLPASVYMSWFIVMAIQVSRAARLQARSRVDSGVTEPV